MDTGLILSVYLVLLLVLLFSGMWVSLAMMLIGIIGIYLWLPRGSEMMLSFVAWATLDSLSLLVIPLFMLMGQVLYESGLSSRLYQGINPLVSRFPGGLLHTNIAACAIFAAIQGSTSATAATIGTVALPELKKRHYDMGMAAGTLAAGGTLGPLIPPSTVLIVYGILTSVSIGQLFMAGVMPGIMLAALFMALIFVRAKLQPSIAPQEKMMPWSHTLISLLSLWPIVLLIGMVLGGIYTGVFTATEAAGIGAFGTILVAVGLKRLTLSVFWRAVRAATQTGCMVIFLVLGAKLMGVSLANLGIPAKIASAVTSYAISPLGVLLLIYVFYLVLGMFMDGLASLTLTIPIVFPIVQALGFDPVWYGVMMVVMCEIGAITPPVAINIFVIHSLDKTIPMAAVIKGGVFMLIATGISLILNTAFPQIALWLPGTMFK